MRRRGGGVSAFAVQTKRFDELVLDVSNVKTDVVHITIKAGSRKLCVGVRAAAGGERARAVMGGIHIPIGGARRLAGAAKLAMMDTSLGTRRLQVRAHASLFFPHHSWCVSVCVCRAGDWGALLRDFVRPVWCTKCILRKSVILYFRRSG